jgi:hypothetical protein
MCCEGDVLSSPEIYSPNDAVDSMRYVLTQVITSISGAYVQLEDHLDTLCLPTASARSPTGVYISQSRHSCSRLCLVTGQTVLVASPMT